jgi:hypothetical protein
MKKQMVAGLAALGLAFGGAASAQEILGKSYNTSVKKVSGASEDGSITIELNLAHFSYQAGTSHSVFVVAQPTPATVGGWYKNFNCTALEGGSNGVLKVFSTKNKAHRAGGGIFTVTGKAPKFDCMVNGESIRVE